MCIASPSDEHSLLPGRPRKAMVTGICLVAERRTRRVYGDLDSVTNRLCAAYNIMSGVCDRMGSLLTKRRSTGLMQSDIMPRTCGSVGPASCSAVFLTLPRNGSSMLSILPGSWKKRPHHVGLQVQGRGHQQNHEQYQLDLLTRDQPQAFR